MIPIVHQRWLSHVLTAIPEDEPPSTCSACAMLPRTPDQDATSYFRPDVKCCTYEPMLANFLVGEILEDSDPAMAPGIATVHTRIAAGEGVSMLGLVSPARIASAYPLLTFGRSPSLKCTHYASDTGACTIWRHRNGVCSTWFCKHERGELGRRFWTAIRELSVAIERALYRWAALQMAETADQRAALAELLVNADPPPPARLDAKGNPDAYKRSWGPWLGREAEYYRATATLVRSLAWSDIVAIGGVELELRKRVLLDVERALAAPLPERLYAAPYRVVFGSADTVRVVTSSSFDPIELPRVLVDLLHVFGGQPVREALAMLLDEHEIELEHDLLLRLVDFGLLVERSEPVPR